MALVIPKIRQLRVPFLLAICAAVVSLAPAQKTASIYGPHGVSPLAIRQGILGSCFFHAALAAIAQDRPSVLRQAIRGNAQTGYRVHFFSGADEIVYPADIAYTREHHFDKSEGVWVTILMRAFAQRKLREGMIAAIEKSPLIPAFVKPTALSALQSSGPLLIAYDRAARSVIDQEGQIDRARFQTNLSRELHTLGISPSKAQLLEGLLDHAGFYAELNNTVKENAEVFGAYRGLNAGGIPRSVLTAFLGNASAAPATSPRFLEQLTALHAGRRAMVATSKHISPFTTPAPEWFLIGHAYTVLDYDSASRTITLRNPWGSRPAPDGVFRLSLTAFQQAYGIFSYSEISAK